MLTFLFYKVIKFTGFRLRLLGKCHDEFFVPRGQHQLLNGCFIPLRILNNIVNVELTCTFIRLRFLERVDRGPAYTILSWLGRSP